MVKIRVCIISPQSLFRQGVRHSLAGVSDIEVSAEAEANDQALAVVENQMPDVVMVDIDAPYEDGLKLARNIRQRLPNIGVIVLTSTPEDDQLFQAIKAQAAAYLSKDITAEELVNTVRRAAKGEHPINESFVNHPKVAEQVLHHFRDLPLGQGAEPFISPVTTREQEILNYMAKGLLNKQIALSLDISEQTVKNHVTSILRKLNANARTQAVVEAIKHGLVSIT